MNRWPCLTRPLAPDLLRGGAVSEAALFREWLWIMGSATGIAQAFADQDFSIVDCTSFAVMQRLGVYRAASFDDDFAVFRFGRARRRAFEVVR